MSHISTLRLHQFRLGELPDADDAALRVHLADCALCAGRLGSQHATQLAFARLPMPSALVPKPTMWERLGAMRWLFVVAPVFAALFLTVRLGPSIVDPVAPGEPDGRTKGVHPGLEAWVQTGQSTRPLYAGEKVRAGTRVQLKYDARGHRFVTLAGRDSVGNVDVYGTLDGAGAGLQTAPFSLTLDDAKGEQAFYAILTDTRPASNEVVDILHRDPVRMDRAEVASLVIQRE